VDGFSVELCGHLGGLAYVPAVHQPEPGGDGGGEVDAVVDERQGCRTRYIFPLSTSRSAYYVNKNVKKLRNRNTRMIILEMPSLWLVEKLVTENKGKKL
jgi:hypothetical protein